MTTKSALHSGAADLEQESGSLIIEAKTNPTKARHISNKMILLASLCLAAYTLIIVMVTWAATKGNNSNNSSSAESIDDDEKYPETLLSMLLSWHRM
jgi:hypothetical protein